MKVGLPAGLLLCCLLALVFRAPNLGHRPFHNDEAVNAVKFRALWEDGTYHYDPNEHHGPTLPYATLLVARLNGWGAFADTHERDFRTVPLLAGLLLILALWWVRDGLGHAGTVWAGVFMALSPSLVFFSRDYIHEMLLVTGTMVVLGGLWRYWVRPGWRPALLTGIGLGLMHATKETFVLNVGAMALAAAVCWGWRWIEVTRPRPPQTWRPAHALVAVGSWWFVAGALFTGFFRQPRGLWDSVITYLPWAQRAAADSPHLHPGSFYWERLFWFSSHGGAIWTELLLLGLALIAVVAAVRNRAWGDARVGWLRFMLFYTLSLGLLYSMIPYKTPWCVLGVVQGLCLLAGAGAATLFQVVHKPPLRAGLAVGLAVLLAHLGWQAWALSQDRVPSGANPWAYAETSADIENLVAQLERVAATHPRGRAMDVQVACSEDDYWPLPFSLRGFSNVGWWSELPPAPLAPVLIVSPDLADRLEETGTHINAGYYALRPSVFRACYVERELWDRVLAGGEGPGY